MELNSATPQHVQILEQIKQSDLQQVKIAVTDIDGVLRGKYLSKGSFLSAASNGLGFCDIVFGWDISDAQNPDTTFTGSHSGFPDVKACVDLDTFRQDPWDNGTPLFLADFVNEQGEPLALCPRQLLKRIIQRAAEMGLCIISAIEYEWFNFNETPQSLQRKNYCFPEPLTPGMFGYSLQRTAGNQSYVTALLEQMRAFGVPLDGLHTETGPGVYEAAIECADPLQAADRAVLFKMGVKSIGRSFGIMPSFIAKWNPELPGCSGHVHQSLWDRTREKNLLASGSGAVNDLSRSYIAGQLQCLPELAPFYAPTVNSYKRLVDGFWAPTNATWGMDNRTVAVRYISSSPTSTRCEMRVPGSDANPYLAMAAALASGLYGVKQGLKLSATPVSGSASSAIDAVRLPRNLQEATARLAESKVARELFGETFVDHFVKTRQWEWEQFQNAVTNWELQRYFEII
jgi:glutamine synthetase